jgi:malate dehydrogenase (oxaloacetate-decarboxylating)(NADP+)
MATGRSDYPNQINNVLGFPYIFRGALDAKAKNITMKMKIAAAEALAELARDPYIPEQVKQAYQRDFKFGKDYIIPTPFDPRLLEKVGGAVRMAVE